MKSKIIAIRLNLITIAACVDLLNKAGVNTANLPLSSCIKQCIESAVNIELSRKTISTRTESNAESMIKLWKKDDPDAFTSLGEQSLISTIKEDAEDAVQLVHSSNFSEETQGPDVEKENTAVQAILEKIQTTSAPDIAQEVEISEEVEIPITNRDELMELNFKTLTEIKDTAPKDRLILGFEEGKDNADSSTVDLYERCIGIIYYHVSVLII